MAKQLQQHQQQTVGEKPTEKNWDEWRETNEPDSILYNQKHQNKGA